MNRKLAARNGRFTSGHHRGTLAELDMETLQYEVAFTTPAFLGDAERDRLDPVLDACVAV